MIVIVMGVSGVGKTSLGEALAERLGWRFIEGDDYHSPENVAKMACGVALADADRWPWLDRLNHELARLEEQGASAVLACSALKESYRRRLTAGLKEFEFIYLHGELELIRRRIAQRKHRYMPATLLESQFTTLEPPAHAIAIDVAAEAPENVAAIAEKLKR